MTKDQAKWLTKGDVLRCTIGALDGFGLDAFYSVARIGDLGDPVVVDDNGIEVPIYGVLREYFAIEAAHNAAPHVHTQPEGAKPTNAENPKDAIGSGKLPLHLWPSTATAMGCIGMLNGMLKYGRANFRAVGIRPSIYADAAKRHIDAWMEGEEVDPDDGVPHLAAALSCLAIIVDARAAGKFNDDRNYPGGYRELVAALTPHVARLKERHADRDPKHYTIADSREAA